MIVLTAEQEVDEQDSNGGAGDDHDAIAEEQKAEHIVDFAEPHVVHDEVELNENSAERKNTDEKHGGDGAQVGGRGRDLAWDLVDANWRLDRLKK